MRWLPNGSGFLYARWNALTDETINIHAYDFTSRSTRQVTNFTGEFVRRFAISPDGRFIVFERVTALDSPSDLWVMGIDGSNPRLLVRQAEIPAWNPRSQ
jgi:Tol biopolymer transport system component